MAFIAIPDPWPLVLKIGLGILILCLVVAYFIAPKK
jgi:hypothetical protein